MESIKILEQKIEFLQKQIEALDRYLPETYQYLMSELDLQQRKLIEYKVHAFYQQQSNEDNYQNPNPTNSNKT